MASPRAPTSGHVARDRFSRTFGALINERATGALRLEDGPRRYAVYWQQGVIVDADSSAPEDTVGRVGLEAGLIDAGSVSESIRRLAQSPGKTQLQLLVEMGALAHEGAAKLARLLLTRRALRVFALPNATFSFSSEDHGRSEGGPVEPRWTLYRGLRLSYDERRLGDELSDLADKAIRLVPAALPILELFGFADEERILTAYLDKGYWELHDLADACLTLQRQVVYAAVAALRAVEALDVQPAAKVPRLRKRARENTLPLRDSQDLTFNSPSQSSILPPGAATGPAPTRAPTPQAPPGRSPSGQTPAPASRGSGQTPAPASRSSGQTPAPPSRSSGPLPPGPTPRASGTAPPVPAMRPGSSSGSNPAVARATGTGPPSGPQPNVTPGGGIADAVRNQIAAKLAQVEAGVDHFTLLEVDRNATTDEIRNKYFEMAKTYHADRLPLVKLEILKPQVDRIFQRLNDAYAALSTEKGRAAYLNILAQGGEAALRKRADEESAKASKILTAEDHFKRGEMHLRREAWASALQDFQVAVDFNPDEADYHAGLAWAKWCAAHDKDTVFGEVRKGLNEALRHNDACVPALLYMGKVYSARGDVDKAYKWFQAVLAVNSSHVDAAREVRIIDSRRAKGGDKKGLFDLFRKK